MLSRIFIQKIKMHILNRYNLFFCLLLSLSYTALGQENQETINPIERIALVAGQQSLEGIAQLQFTFQVERDSKVLRARAWTWNLQTQDVTLKDGATTTTYNRSQPMDSLQTLADKSFVNDTYWLLPEYKFYTDAGTQIITKEKTIAPIAKVPLNLFTIIYGGDGGYTPGDAYDVYYNDDYVLQEWAYRAGNGPNANLQNTFANHQPFNGLTVATEHVFADGKTNIKLTNIAVTR